MFMAPPHHARCPDSPPPMPEACLRHDGEGIGVGGTPTRNVVPSPRRDSPPPCGEGIGVGGAPPRNVLPSPPPLPSPTRGEGARPARGEAIRAGSDRRSDGVLRRCARY